MKETRRNPVNRCFPLLFTERQREEEVKRILLAVTERKRTKGRKEVLKALLKKAAKRKMAETRKKVSAKAVPKERDLMREGAEHLVSGLKKASRDGSLMDLLPMVSRKVREGKHDAIVLKVLIERIRRNQWNDLSFKDQCLVIQAEASLGKQTN